MHELGFTIAQNVDGLCYCWIMEMNLHPIYKQRAQCDILQFDPTGTTAAPVLHCEVFFCTSIEISG